MRPSFMGNGGRRALKRLCLVCMCAAGGAGPWLEWRASARIVPKPSLNRSPTLLVLSLSAVARRHRPTLTLPRLRVGR